MKRIPMNEPVTINPTRECPVCLGKGEVPGHVLSAFNIKTSDCVLCLGVGAVDGTCTCSFIHEGPEMGLKGRKECAFHSQLVKELS